MSYLLTLLILSVLGRCVVGGSSLFAQPPAHRLIIKFQAEPGQQDAACIDGESRGPHFAERIVFVFDQPRVEQVHHGVVDGIERIGDVACKPAYPGGMFVRRLSGSGQPHQQREHEEDAEHFVQTVQADALFTFYIRNAEQCEQHGCTNPEGPLDFDGLEVARKQHTQCEGEEHAQQSAQEVGAIQCPSYTDHAVSHHVEQSEPSQTYSRQDGQQGQHLVAQAVDEERIEDITDVFEEERPARTVQRKHLAVAAYVVAGSRGGGNEDISPLPRMS